MTDKERKIKCPVSIRFKDWKEIYDTWTPIDKAIVSLTFFLFLPWILTWTIMSEIEFYIINKMIKEST